MELYLKLIQLFCKVRDSLFSVFASGKPLCKEMVSLSPLELNWAILCFFFALLTPSYLPF